VRDLARSASSRLFSSDDEIDYNNVEPGTENWELSIAPMQVHILFFGMLKDLAGRTSDSLSLPDNATLGDVISHYEERIPRLKDLIASIAMSVNQEYVGPESKLKPGDEIALLPPVSGGTGGTVGGTPTRQPKEPALSERSEPKGRRRYKHAAIVRERIETESLLEGIKRPEDGAAVVFEGIVRNHSRGRRTLYLDYEAYEEMALKQMEALAEQALSQFQIRDVAIVHRLGRLEIGETSVLIVVASAHRAAAFEACRWLIDTLKRTVPIWKKEYFEDGAAWADGEPFPAEVPRAEGTHSGRPASK
jgi:molybdopterin converting factor subunit 1